MTNREGTGKRGEGILLVNNGAKSLRLCVLYIFQFSLSSPK
jgi:hypothetical protein